MIVFGAILFATIFGFGATYIFRKKMHIWLARSLKRRRPRPRPDSPIDIMFLFVDHFELAGKEERLAMWIERYPLLADRHRDFDGKPPQHTWFYAIDLLHDHELGKMSDLARRGYGEIEMHWHHNHDSENAFIRDLRAGLSAMQKHGLLLPYDEKYPACFAFIHGNWSLANSRGRRFCGIDDEVRILKEHGCYADFTFPALFQDAQPSYANQFLYARPDGRAKPYERGWLATTGRQPAADELMLFQGPLAINWRDWRFLWHPAIEDGDINFTRTQSLLPRIRCWINQRIHIPGQPNWWFVKVFCHGAQDRESVLGEQTDRMHELLREHYNDGVRYRLHYVTAREAYNIAKAAEAGHSGNPGNYRNFEIPRPMDRNIVKELS